jgi:hypothetical protein
MFQKLTPLIILLIFVIGTLFVIWGLEKASDMTQSKRVEQRG